MHPVLFRIPIVDWPLHTYGVLIALGFVMGIFVATREARRQGEYEDEALDFAFWALVGGLVGARVYFIAVNWHQYFVTNPWVTVEWLPFRIPAILAVWQGGLVFYGGALGGVIAFLIYAYRHKLHLGKFADLAIVSLPLGHFFGRLGCFAAGCCWGEPAFHLDAGKVIADMPWAASFPPQALAYTSLIRTADAETVRLMTELGSTLPLHPVQLYESLGELLVFAILVFVRSRKWFHGQVALTFFILYPILRSTLELFRGDPERGYVIDGVLSVGQFTSMLVALTSLGIIIYRRVALSRNQTATA
ncbi:MAG: prolipoprotein diacylglyceryl transferase [Pseudomonadota bacterium]